MPRAPFHLETIKAVLAEKGEMRQADLARVCNLAVGTLFAAVKPGLRTGVLLIRHEGRAAFYRLAPGVEPAPPRPFAVVIDAAGVDLYGLIEVRGGGRRMTMAMLEQMRAHAEGIEQS